MNLVEFMRATEKANAEYQQTVSDASMRYRETLGTLTIELVGDIDELNIVTEKKSVGRDNY